MNEITKKFLDILFEPDEQNVKAEEPSKDVKEKEFVKNTEANKVTKSPNAKDILYGKQDKASSFIDYFEVPKVEKKIEKVDESYEMRDNVSPIFGPIIQKERKKKPANEKDIQKAVTNTSSNEYIGIVLSPIYGYDINKANDARKVLDRFNKKEEYIEEEELFTSAEPAFDIPEDMKETIEEAVKEAVVELNTMEAPIINKDIVEDEIIEEPVYEKETIEEAVKEAVVELNTMKAPIINNDIVEDEIIEKPEYEEEIIEEYNDLSNEKEQYEYDEPVSEEIFDDYENVTNEDLYQDVESHTSEYEKIDEEVFNDDSQEYQDTETTYQDGEETYETYVKEEDEETTLTEDINDSTIDDALQDIRQATRSIYDTTPIQLFDYDEISDSKDSEKDLFDELIGDDD